MGGNLCLLNFTFCLHLCLLAYWLGYFLAYWPGVLATMPNGGMILAAFIGLLELMEIFISIATERPILLTCNGNVDIGAGSRLISMPTEIQPSAMKCSDKLQSWKNYLTNG